MFQGPKDYIAQMFEVQLYMETVQQKGGFTFLKHGVT